VSGTDSIFTELVKEEPELRKGLTKKQVERNFASLILY
jgi:hypothetical protein